MLPYITLLCEVWPEVVMGGDEGDWLLLGGANCQSNGDTHRAANEQINCSQSIHYESVSPF